MANNLTKRDIILKICESTNYPQKEVKEIVQLTLDTIQNALCQNQNVELRNFGVFKLQIRKQRIGRNPNKPEKDVVIPDRIVVKFESGKEIKAKLKDMNVQSFKKRLSA